MCNSLSIVKERANGWVRVDDHDGCTLQAVSKAGAGDCRWARIARIGRPSWADGAVSGRLARKAGIWDEYGTCMAIWRKGGGGGRGKVTGRGESKVSCG